MGKCDMSSPFFLYSWDMFPLTLATEMSASGPSNEVSRMASLSVNLEWLFRSTEVWTRHVFCIRGWRVLVAFWIWCRLCGQFLHWPFHPFLLNLPVQNATHWDKCRTCTGSNVAVSRHYFQVLEVRNQAPSRPPSEPFNPPAKVNIFGKNAAKELLW